MRCNRWLAAAGLLGGMIASSAGAEEKVTGAAKALADKSGYSWTSTSQDAAGGGDANANRRGPGPVNGQTEKGGYTHLTYTMGDNSVEAVVKGDKGAVKAADGWKTTEELGAAAGGGGGGGQQRDPSAFLARRLRTFKLPAAEAEELAGKATDLKDEGGALVGTLPEEAVKEILSRRGGRGGGGGGNNAPTVTGAKGTVKFWIKDGVLVKFEVNYQGTVGDRQSNRTTVTEIKEVGTTKVVVPEDAKKKLP
jgi:hypothetical protein